MSIPISYGAGTASIASEKVGNNDYQQVKIVDGTAASTNKWIINSDGSAQVSVVGGIVISGSIAAAIVSGSIVVTTTPPANQSVSGTVGASIVGQLPAGTAVLGSVAALQGTNPWIVTSSVAGGLFPISGSVAAVITNANVNVSGSVAAFVTGSSSIITVWKDSSVLSVPVGSVVTVLQSSSILAVPVGSVITVWQNASIAGTYAEDAAHASGDRGLLSLNVRNDTMASVTSADGDYGALALGPSGEAVVANAPITKWIRGTADLRVVLGSSVTAIAAQGASIFTYITGIQVANMGSASVLVTFGGGLGSILGYTIAPAGGGSNILYPNALKTGENSAFTASISGTASVLVSAQGFIAKI